MRLIQLSKGYQTIVDDEDFEMLNSYKWTFHKGRKTNYAKRVDKITGKCILMHRQILGIIDSKLIGDHRDRNGLNNCRYNLRICDHSNNGANAFRPKKSSSKYKGVYFSITKGKWAAAITKNYKCKYLGLFINEEDAAIAYNLAAKKIHGEFAYLNDVTQ